MARSNLCNEQPKWVRAIESAVVDTFTYFQNFGHNRTTAIEQTALELGLTPRRVWSFNYQQPTAPTREEHDRVFRAYLRHLDARAEEYARRAEAVKAKRRQMEAGL